MKQLPFFWTDNFGFFFSIWLFLFTFGIIQPVPVLVFFSSYYEREIWVCKVLKNFLSPRFLYVKFASIYLWNWSLLSFLTENFYQL